MSFQSKKCNLDKKNRREKSCHFQLKITERIQPHPPPTKEKEERLQKNL